MINLIRAHRNLFLREPTNNKLQQIGKLEEDELNKGKYKVKIGFELGRGSYATNVVKFLML